MTKKVTNVANAGILDARHQFLGDRQVLAVHGNAEKGDTHEHKHHDVDSRDPDLRTRKGLAAAPARDEPADTQRNEEDPVDRRGQPDRRA